MENMVIGGKTIGERGWVSPGSTVYACFERVTRVYTFVEFVAETGELWRARSTGSADSVLFLVQYTDTQRTLYTNKR